MEGAGGGEEVKGGGVGWEVSGKKWHGGFCIGCPVPCSNDDISSPKNKLRSQKSTTCLICYRYGFSKGPPR